MGSLFPSRAECKTHPSGKIRLVTNLRTYHFCALPKAKETQKDGKEGRVGAGTLPSLLNTVRWTSVRPARVLSICPELDICTFQLFHCRL